jgi:cytochrome c
VHPEADGTATIPKGNLFPPGTPNTRPEIYVMGNRNPWRIAVDRRSGFLYWGEVGPDAGGPNENRGPAGFDEINQARAAGNFGWPLIIADNKPYRRHDLPRARTARRGTRSSRSMNRVTTPAQRNCRPRSRRSSGIRIRPRPASRW